MTRLLRSVTARPSKTSSTKELRDLIENGRTSAQLAPCHRINLGLPLQIRRSEQPHLCEKPSLSTRIFPNSPRGLRPGEVCLTNCSACQRSSHSPSLSVLFASSKDLKEFVSLPSTGMKLPDAFLKGQGFTPCNGDVVSSFAGQALSPLLLLPFFTCALRLLTVRHLSTHAAHGYRVRI